MIDKKLKKVLNKVLFRSLGIQNLWNYQYMQLYGYLFSLFPLYQYLFDKDEIKKRLKIQWGYFNTHPYMISYILAIHSRMLLFREDEKKIKRTVNLLMAPLASIGDSFFWGTLRSFLIVTATLFVLIFQHISIIALSLLLILLFFNLFHLYHIFIGFKKSFNLGKTSLKFGKKFFFIERMINIITSLILGIIISKVIIEFANLNYKYYILFIFFLILNYFHIRVIKNQYIIVFINFLISIIIVIGRFL